MSATLVIGGRASGKSARAEALAAQTGAPVVVLATGAPDDPEMAERIAAHRSRRPAAWRTVESVAVDRALAEAAPAATVLVDDLDGWITARMGRHDLWSDAAVAPLGEEGRAAVETIVSEAEAWWRLARERPGAVVVVAGQAGWGPAPTGVSTRRWLDVHGTVLQRLAADADAVEVVVAGRVLRPGAVPRAPAPPDPPGDQPHGPDPALRHHGDRQVPAGAVDLAVNVLAGPPAWLVERLGAALGDLARYPDPAAAREAAAARHDRPAAECLPLNGAAEGFWLLARALRPGLAACVHPEFTEGEAALRAAGAPVVRVARDPGDWSLDPTAVPAAADLVLLGRPGNPTGVLDPEDVVAGLCRPGRVVVVDEAFAEVLPEAAGVAGRRDLPGLVALRSLTKVWGLAGLRVGYLVGPADLVARLERPRQPWSVNALALAALETLVEAEEARRARVAVVARHRRHLVERLRAIPGLDVWDSAASYVLVRSPRPDLRERLLEEGLAVRRGDTFPGLDARHLRVAVRPPETSDRLAAAIADHLAGAPR